MKEFEFISPNSISEALKVTSSIDEEYRYMAGATALMLVMRQRIVNPKKVISLKKIKSLRGIAYEENFGLRIGALTTHREIAESPLIQRHYPVVAYMASIMANPQVRNQGTIGGNLCYGDSSTDPPTCLIAHKARIVLVSSQGQREIDLKDFYLGFFETDLQDGEILLEIKIPPRKQNAVAIYERFRKTDAEHRPTMNFCISGIKENGYISDVVAAVGASTKIPQRLFKMEQELQSKYLKSLDFNEFAEIGANEAEYIDDSRSDAKYRKHITRVVISRAIAKLADK